MLYMHFHVAIFFLKEPNRSGWAKHCCYFPWCFANAKNAVSVMSVNYCFARILWPSGRHPKDVSRCFSRNPQATSIFPKFSALYVVEKSPWESHKWVIIEIIHPYCWWGDSFNFAAKISCFWRMFMFENCEVLPETRGESQIRILRMYWIHREHPIVDSLSLFPMLSLSEV